MLIPMDVIIKESVMAPDIAQHRNLCSLFVQLIDDYACIFHYRMKKHN